MNFKPFNFIINEKSNSGERITYQDELSSLEWQEKRSEIIERDGNICNNCKAQVTTLINRFPHRKKTKEEEQEYKNRMRKAWDEVVRMYESFGLPSSQSPKFSEDIEIPLEITDKHIILHVHHKYYIQTNRAWQYDNDALITLCSTCHQDTHNKNTIPVYSDESMIEQLNLTKCSKCNGSGYLGEYHYYLNGICFGCNGYKYLELIQR